MPVDDRTAVLDLRMLEAFVRPPELDERLVALLSEERLVILQSPTGAGKSTAAIELLQSIVEQSGEQDVLLPLLAPLVREMVQLRGRRDEARSAQVADAVRECVPRLLARLRRVKPVRFGPVLLVVLWRRVDRARAARALSVRCLAGRLWTDFRSARPPGRVVTASGRVTRGPDASRTTHVSVVCGEPFTLK